MSKVQAKNTIFEAVNGDKNITISFSGHRSYDNCEDERLREVIRNLYDEGYRIFLCGMARGFDLAAGECVAGMREELHGVQLRCIIPFLGQERSFSKRDQERFTHLVKQADEVVTLSEHYQAGAYHTRNNYLVDNASAIVAFYNGERGGTHYTLHRAVKRGLRIHNICTYRIGELFQDFK